MSQENVTQKIWNLCHILRGDGVSYHQYISELTYLLFLKIAENNNTQELLPVGYRWVDLSKFEGDDLLTFYRDMLTYLGGHAEDERVRKIYAFPTTVFSHQENLRAIIDGIDKIEWSSIGSDGMGHIYEGLIAKNSQDARSGAGQYFTPRPLVESIIRLMQPRLGEIIQDPSTGSGGFLIEANKYITKTTNKDEYAQLPPVYEGIEIEKDTYRICLMNSFLHGLDINLILGDAMTGDADNLLMADLILANPPFGAKAGSARKKRVNIPYPTVNKQLLFLQHIYLGLKPSGRAAVVLPDNVLFEDGVGKKIRQDFMNKCNVHTILRLPIGIFYAAAVKTNVVFFTRGETDEGNTKSIWFYDMRTNMPTFGKTSPLREGNFKEFEAFYGADSLGNSVRVDQGENGRFREFSREFIKHREDNLDIIWLREKNEVVDQSRDAEDILAAINGHLAYAMLEIEGLMEDLSLQENNSTL